jgi:hypothetical protein
VELEERVLLTASFIGAAWWRAGVVVATAAAAAMTATSDSPHIEATAQVFTATGFRVSLSISTPCWSDVTCPRVPSA